MQKIKLNLNRENKTGFSLLNEICKILIDPIAAIILIGVFIWAVLYFLGQNNMIGFFYEYFKYIAISWLVFAFPSNITYHIFTKNKFDRYFGSENKHLSVTVSGIVFFLISLVIGLFGLLINMPVLVLPSAFVGFALLVLLIAFPFIVMTRFVFNSFFSLIMNFKG